MKLKTSFACLMVAGVSLMATPQIQAGDIVDTAVGAGNFKTLVAAVKAAGLVDTLKSKGPFTVFAPTDDAFARIPADVLQDLLKPENKDKLTSILTYHVVSGKVPARTAFGLNEAATVNGQKIAIRRNSGRLVINDSLVTVTDIECSNGVIHVIDKVLMPESSNIPEVAAAAGQFSTLLAAVTEAELAETLSGKGPFTVFAPTDAAFAKLPAGTVESLLKPENRKQLISILTYHVVSGRVYSADAVKLTSAPTLQGGPVKIELGGNGIQINDAKVVTPDVEASNGVIHVIDSVLLPPKLTAADSRRLLEEAVMAGSQAYNRGDTKTCASLYENVCQEIVAGGYELPESVPAVLKASLQRAANISHDGERAWVLRHGIDLAYYSLH